MTTFSDIAYMSATASVCRAGNIVIVQDGDPDTGESPGKRVKLEQSAELLLHHPQHLDL